MRFLRFVIGLTAAVAINVQAANVEEYTSQLPDGANLALMVQKVGATSPFIDYHSQQMALPASTQKVLYKEIEKQLRSTMAAAGGALKHCVMSFHGQPGALSWLAKIDVSTSTLPLICWTPAFFNSATMLRIS